MALGPPPPPVDFIGSLGDHGPFQFCGGRLRRNWGSFEAHFSKNNIFKKFNDLVPDTRMIADPRTARHDPSRRELVSAQKV